MSYQGTRSLKDEILLDNGEFDSWLTAVQTEFLATWASLMKALGEPANSVSAHPLSTSEGLWIN